MAIALPRAHQRRCLWHQLQNLIRDARERYPRQEERQREVIQRGKAYLEASSREAPRTTSPLERAIKEYQRRTRSMDDFGSLKGAGNLLRAWLVKCLP